MNIAYLRLTSDLPLTLYCHCHEETEKCLAKVLWRPLSCLLHVSCWFLSLHIVRPWIWRLHDPPKHQYMMLYTEDRTLNTTFSRTATRKWKKKNENLLSVCRAVNDLKYIPYRRVQKINLQVQRHSEQRPPSLFQARTKCLLSLFGWSKLTVMGLMWWGITLWRCQPFPHFVMDPASVGEPALTPTFVS
jgi:hypothetical protein